MTDRSIADLFASLTWDLEDFNRGTTSIENGFKSLMDKAQQLGERFRTIGRDMTLALSLPLGGFGAFAISAASDAEELQSAFNQTFGSMAGAMNEWAQASGDALGRSTQSMQRAAGSFGSFFNQAASTREEAAKMSQTFAVLTQDLSSFYNVSESDALNKLRSGLSGESEPLRDFGVFLSEATVEAKAFELGLAATKKELTEQDKVLARYQLILEGTAAAQGDVERTSGSFANQVRRLQAAFEELKVAIGERLLPIITPLIERVTDLVESFTELPKWVQDAAVRFGVFLFAIGPVLSVLTTLAVIILPLFLARLGPVFFGLSLLINPLGTIVVFLGKLAGGFVTSAGGIARVLPLLGRLALTFARLNPVVSAVITLFTFFGDSISSALGRVWEKAQEALGPAFQRLFDAVESLILRVSDAFAKLAASPIGQFLGQIMDLLGQLVGALVEIAGTAVVAAIELLINLITTIVELVSDVVTIVVLLLQGEWQTAWNHAQQAVANAINNMWPSFQNLYNWIYDGLAAIGLLEARARAMDNVGTFMGGGLAGFPLIAEGRIAPARRAGGGGGGGRPARSRGGGRPRGGGGRKGPTAEELAERRAELDFEHQLALAREKGDQERIRALERQADLKRKIEAYEKAGLSNADARVMAERQMLELDAARSEVLVKEIGSLAERNLLEIAKLEGDWESVRALERQFELEEMIAELVQKGADAAKAEEIATANLLDLEEARAAATARRLRDAEFARQIELARLRGDSDGQIAAMEEQARIEERIRELQSEDELTPGQAQEQALREASDRSRAHLQGNFREAFRGGLQAALDGNLKDFFKRWLEDASFNALAKVLDRLADRLADLVFGGPGAGAGGGGLFSVLGGLLGIGGGAGAATSRAVSAVSQRASGFRVPGFANGGSLRFGGLAGVDRNLLSLNGTPIARVSRGEVMDIHQGGGGGMRGELLVRLEKDGGLSAHLRGIAGQVVNERAPAIGALTQQATLAKLQQMQDDRLE
jgi:hypothetical protein